jgi:hypothetical protein
LSAIIAGIEGLHRINVKKFWEVDDGGTDHPFGLRDYGCGCV